MYSSYIFFSMVHFIIEYFLNNLFYDFFSIYPTAKLDVLHTENTLNMKAFSNVNTPVVDYVPVVRQYFLKFENTLTTDF